MAQFIRSTSIELINKCFIVIIYLVILIFDNKLVYTHPKLFNGRISFYGNIPGPFGMPRDVDLEPIVQMAPDIGAPPGIIDPRSPNLRNLWVKQYVDNFNLDNTKTWKNLYLMNSEFYEGDGPIFLMIRGESPVSRGFMFAGAWTMYAQKYKAMLFQLEQRYYGSSYPVPDLSLDNMGYLTVQQTLADLANFIHAMNTKHKFLPTQKWIVFGGSYGGALAVWLRLLYPQLVYGVVSSSGPINLVVDFKKYLYAITKTLSAYPGCVSGIKSAYSKIRSQIKTVKDRKKLRHELILCESFKHPSQSDIATLFYSLSGDFAYVVQYSGDNTNNNNVTIADTCKALSKPKKPSLKGMKKFLKMSLEESNANCDGFEYQSTIQMLKDTVIKSLNVLSGNRQWLYQQCTQLGIFQTSDSKHQVFGDLFPLAYFYKQCTDVFGSNFVPITEITLPYSGLRPNTTNVLCVQGSLDPWRMLGLTKNLTAGVEAIYIQGTGHAADMYEPSPTDVPGLTEARILTSKFIGKLLAKAKKEYKTTISTPLNHPLHTISTSVTKTPLKSNTIPPKSASISNILLSSSAINSASKTLTSVSATSASNSTSSQTLSSSITNRAHLKSLSSTSITAKLDREASLALRSQTSASQSSLHKKKLKIHSRRSSKSSSTTHENSEPWLKSYGKSSVYLQRLKLRSKINSLLAQLYGKSSGTSFSVPSHNKVHTKLIPEPSDSNSIASYSTKFNDQKSHITKVKPMVSNSSATMSTASKPHKKLNGQLSSSAQPSTADSSVTSKSPDNKAQQPLGNLTKSDNKITIKASQPTSVKLSKKTSSAQSSTAKSSGKSKPTGNVTKQKHGKRTIKNFPKSSNETIVKASQHTSTEHSSAVKSSVNNKSTKHMTDLKQGALQYPPKSSINATTIVEATKHSNNSTSNAKPSEKTSSAQPSTAVSSVTSKFSERPFENSAKSVSNKTIIVASQHSGNSTSSAQSSTAVSSGNSKSSDPNEKPLENSVKSNNKTIIEASLAMPSTSNISATIMLVPSKSTTKSASGNNSTSSVSSSTGSASSSPSSSSPSSSSSTPSSSSAKRTQLASKTKPK